MSVIKAVLFDGDGTLIDTWKWAVMYHQIVAKKMGWQIPSKEQIAQVWGLEWRIFLDRLWPGMTEEIFLPAYEKHKPPRPKIQPVAGALELIELLSSQVYLALLTNRDPKTLFKYLSEAGFDEKMFHLIQSLENGQPAKPDPKFFDKVIADMAKCDIKPKQAIYVGDSPYDHQATYGTGIRFKAVLTGCGTREIFLDLGVPEDDILESVSLLTQLIHC